MKDEYEINERNYETKLSKLKKEKEKLLNENDDLKKELSKDIQEDMKKQLNSTLTEFPNNFNYSIVCPKCPEKIPILSVSEKNNQIYVNLECNECNYKETFELSKFLQRTQELNKDLGHYCEKSDGSHKDIKAAYFYQGKYYCKECAEGLKKVVNPNEIKTVDSNVEYTTEKNKFYCINCKRHYAGDFAISEHNPSHTVIDLGDLNKEFDLKRANIKIENVFQN